MYRLVYLLMLLVIAGPALATTRYINDELRVPLRKSPCGNCAILHNGLKSGLKLTVIETADGWSHISTPGGLEGWMESQYLVDEPIARTQLAELRKRHEAIKTRDARIGNSLEESETELNLLQDELVALQEDNNAMAAELAEIREISTDTLTLHTQNQELIKQNKMLQNEIDVLTATTERLTNSNAQKWFFYGALAVVMGALLAILLPRMRRRSRGYSEWA